jgi:hypothetical protein
MGDYDFFFTLSSYHLLALWVIIEPYFLHSSLKVYRVSYRITLSILSAKKQTSVKKQLRI